MGLLGNRQGHIEVAQQQNKTYSLNCLVQERLQVHSSPLLRLALTSA